MRFHVLFELQNEFPMARNFIVSVFRDFHDVFATPAFYFANKVSH